MSNITTYRVAAASFSDAEVTLQVDLDVLTPALAAEINNFWSHPKDRLQAEDGDVVRAVVRMFGEAAIRHFMADGGASFGPCPWGDRQMTAEVLKAQVEGWPDIDGLGIGIVGAEVSAVGYHDVTLEAV
ncbi:MAG: hypothetical protein A3E01_05345 [Gammaproteobacteria bacterium RIFCSPHIGHO2_12_FULL_63_22]|nr:MAG: hypothetical protein A3E01_05345 [Gammaproteobacteria bacterium RIFCSPHIGHO2_12_FULL_63_22]